MKLWNPNEPVVGGWYFVTEDGKSHRAEKPGVVPLAIKVEAYLTANGKPVPDYLEELIEDQICSRQPKTKCRYTKKPGDLLSQVIHSVAGAVDSVAGTQLQKRARRCGKCGQRRTRMNQLLSSTRHA